MIKVFALVLRQTTEIIQATVNTHPSVHKDLDGQSQKVFKVLCYDTTSWVKENFEPAVNAFNENRKDLSIQMEFTQDRLDVKTAKFAAGYDAVCLFVNDTADLKTIRVLSMCRVNSLDCVSLFC